MPESCALCEEHATDERHKVPYCLGHLLLTIMLEQPARFEEAS